MTPDHPITDNDTWEQEFDERFGVAPRTIKGEGRQVWWDMSKYPSPTEVKDFIRSLLLSERRRAEQEFKEKVEKAIQETTDIKGLTARLFQIIVSSLRSIQTEKL